MTTREQLESEAEDLYPKFDEPGYETPGQVDRQLGYVEGRTVNADRLDQAAEGLWRRWNGPELRGSWRHTPEHHKNSYRTDARVVLRHAGLLVVENGGDDD